MQNYYKTIGALAAASALVAGNASAEVEYEIHTGYTNEYLFRGADLGDDLVEVGVDVSTEWNGLGLSAGAWYGSFQSSIAPSTLEFAGDELDLYAEVSKDLGFATAAIGYISYQNLEQYGQFVDNAQEVYFSLAREFFGIDFSLAYYWDVESDNDGYTELRASKGFELSACLTLSFSSALGYAFEEGDLIHLTNRVSLDWAFTETATLSPFVAHSFGLGETATVYSNRNEFVAGTMLSVSF